MFQLLLIALMLSAPVSWSWANTPRFFVDNRTSVLYVDLDDKSVPKLKVIDSAKASLVKDAMTLRTLVDALGPGYMGPNEGVGLIRWHFSNGKILYVRPRTCTEPEVLHFHARDGNSSLMWWSK